MCKYYKIWDLKTDVQSFLFSDHANRDYTGIIN